jgi:hypothetical protein
MCHPSLRRNKPGLLLAQESPNRSLHWAKSLIPKSGGCKLGLDLSGPLKPTSIGGSDRGTGILG